MKTFTLLSLAVLFTVGTLMAQNPGRGQGTGPGAATTPVQSQAGKKTLETVTISGTVTEIDLHEFELECPTVTIDGTIDGEDADPVEVKLAPIWFLLENDFEVEIGDMVEIIALVGKCLVDPPYYAISIDELVLREDDGSPVWNKGGGASTVTRGSMRRCSVKNDCILPDSINVIEGTVASIQDGKGIQHLTLIMKVSGTGMLLQLKLGPARYLLDQGLELKAGGPVVVRYAVTTRVRTWLVLGIGDGEGPMVPLRTDTGEPLWR